VAGFGGRVKRITVDTAEPDRATALLDSARTFRRAYGLNDDALLLVRPDGYIGHIALRDMLVTTQNAASAMTPPPGPDTSAPHRRTPSDAAE
jgi:hypothetical protein